MGGDRAERRADVERPRHRANAFAVRYFPPRRLPRAVPDAELAVSLPEDTWLRAVATAHPEAVFRVLAAMPAESGAVALLELTAADVAAVVAHVDRQPAVADLDLLWSRGEESLLLVEATDPVAVRPALRAGVPLRTPLVVRGDTATWRVTAPDDRLSALTDRLREAGLSFEVARVTTPTEVTTSVGGRPWRDGASDGGLTDRQREALSLAAEMGYYATPREATLTEVADALGVAKSTASDLLHRAEGTVVEERLASLPDRPDPEPRQRSDAEPR